VKQFLNFHNKEFLFELAEKFGVKINCEDDYQKIISIKDYAFSSYKSVEEVFLFISSISLLFWLFGPNLILSNDNLNEVINIVIVTFNCKNFQRFYQEFQFQVGALIISPSKILHKFRENVEEVIQFLIALN
jgi:hypothetical protein